MKLKKEIRFLLYAIINILTIYFLKNIVRTNITTDLKIICYILFNCIYVIELIKKN